MFYVDQNKWDIENNVENKKKIWTIANERYKGWRSSLSATYKAYTTYDERMINKPEDLDIVNVTIWCCILAVKNFRFENIYFILGSCSC